MGLAKKSSRGRTACGCGSANWMQSSAPSVGTAHREKAARLGPETGQSQAEHHHPIRLFAGSGMPEGVWRRVLKRFGPARVVEFFASSEGNAVLVNLTGEKVGCPEAVILSANS